MLYYVYIWNLETDEIVMHARMAGHASEALNAQRRKLRRYGWLEKGTLYRVCIFDETHDSNKPDWNNFHWSEVKTAR